MNKFIALMMVTLGVTALQAEDSYLWWWITPGGAEYESWQESDYSNARIKAVNEQENKTSYLNIYSQGVNQGTTIEDINYGGKYPGATKSYYGAALGSMTGSGWTYFLEVYNSDNGWNGMAEDGLAYDDAGKYISLGGTSLPSEIFDFGSIQYTAVPEPNSALLLMLGLSALALRRKQKRA